MRMILSLLLATCFVKANAQDTLKNFVIVKNTSVHWQKMVVSEKSFVEVLAEMKQSGNFENIESDGKQITARLLLTEPDYKGAGYHISNSPIYLLNGKVTAFVLISKQANGFELTLKRIELNDKDGVIGIEKYALKRDKTFANSFRHIPSNILRHTFNSLFSFLE